MKVLAVFFMKKTAVINVHNNTCLALADTPLEASTMLDTCMRGVPAGRIESMGFRIRPVMVTVQELPDTAFVAPSAHQGALFS